LGLSYNLSNNEFLTNFEPSEIRDENREVFVGLKNKSTDSSLERLELLSFAAESEMKEQQLDPNSELGKTASELKKLILKEEMQELANKIAMAEKSKDRATVEQLSKRYVLLSNQLKNY
jgi:hypothetical protein